jgi:serine/threonine-protein kinase
MTWTLAGRYRLIGPIARGTTGEVWRAVDLGTDQPVAVKLLHPRLARDQRLVERLQQARRTLTGLWHPAIARLIDVVASDGTVALVADLVPGTDLARELARSGPLPAERAVPVAVALAEALQVAHDSGVMHGDLKPANVILPAEGGVPARLTDFSVATLVRVGRPPGSHGSPYTAPWEIDGAVSTPSGDVYALGTVLLEMLTGTTSRDDPAAAATDPRLLAVIDWCVVGDRATRPSARAVAEELRGLLPQVPAAGPGPPARLRPVTPTEPAGPGPPGGPDRGRDRDRDRDRPAAPREHPADRPRRQRRDRHRLLVLAGVGAVAVAAAAITAVVVLTPDEPGSPLPTVAGTSGPGGSAPTLPQAATVDDTGGGATFVRYWFDTLSYATRTGDTTTFAEASSPDCPDCQAMIETIESHYDQGGSLRGGAYVVRSVTTADLWAPDRQVFDATVDRGTRTELDPAGAPQATMSALSFHNCVLVLEFTDQRWLVREVVSPDSVG